MAQAKIYWDLENYSQVEKVTSCKKRKNEKMRDQWFEYHANPFEADF